MTTETFNRLYRSHWRICMQYARKCLQGIPGSILEPADLVQQVFMNIWEKGPSECSTGLLIFLVRQRGTDHFRKMRVEERGLQQYLISEPVDLSGEIREAINRLPRQKQYVLNLFLAGYDGAEMAELLNANQSTVRYWKAEAVKEVKKRFYPSPVNKP